MVATTAEGAPCVPLPQHLLRMGTPLPATTPASRMLAVDFPLPAPPPQEIADFGKCLDALKEELAGLRKRQDSLGKKQEDADQRHRGQLESVTNRVFQVETDLRGLQQREAEAIDKVGAAMQVLNVKMQQNSQTTAQVAGHVSETADRLGQDVQGLDRTVRCVQQELAALKHSLPQVQDMKALQRMCQDLAQRHDTEMRRSAQTLQEAMQGMVTRKEVADAVSQLEVMSQKVADLAGKMDNGMVELTQLASQVRRVAGAKRLQGLPRSPKALQGLPRASNVLRGLPKTSKAFRGLPMLSKAVQVLLKPSKTLQGLSRRSSG